MRPARHLVIFAKAPRLGQVKRRLAAEIGDVEALRFYRASLGGLIRRLANDRHWTVRLAVTPDRAAATEFPFAHGLTVVAQGEGDLGARMDRAIAGCPPGPAILIGTDIPAVSAGHIARAFELLRGAEVVFGPAADGGYWLVGASAAGRRKLVFGPARWSTRHALADSRAGLPAGTRVALADTLEDIDTAAAYARWRAAAGPGRTGQS